MSELKSLQDDLERLAGAASQVSARGSYAVDDHVPKIVTAPDTESALARILSYANRRALSVVPWGLGARQSWGEPLERADIVVSLERLAGVVEFDSENLTLTARAGSSLSELESAAAKANQRVALTPPLPNATTVGGLLALNVPSATARAFGNCRDQALGLRAALAEGHIISSGGKTMKNVAGYDLTRLFIGSFGTLGVITQATFRTAPLPETSASIQAAFPESGTAQQFIAELLASPMLPVSLNLLTGACAASGAGPLALISYEASGIVVDRELRETHALLKKHGATQIQILHDHQHDERFREVQDYPAKAATLGVVGILRLTVPLGSVVRATGAAETLARSLAFRPGCLAHAGSGVVQLYLWSTAAPEVAAEKLRDLVPTLRATARRLRGHLFVERSPLPVRHAVPCVGLEGAAVPLMARLKDALDPRNILNRGRLPLTVEKDHSVQEHQ